MFAPKNLKLICAIITSQNKLPPNTSSQERNWRIIYNTGDEHTGNRETSICKIKLKPVNGQ